MILTLRTYAENSVSVALLFALWVRPRRRQRYAFSPQGYGHSGLLDMIRTYDLLTARAWQPLVRKVAPKQEFDDGRAPPGVNDRLA